MVVPLVTLKDHEKFIIKFLLVNSNPIKASWYLNPKKICLCNNRSMVNKNKKKLNCDKNCFYCIHDQSCAIYPKKITLMVQFSIKN
jgi:hypothetical protein